MKILFLSDLHYQSEAQTRSQQNELFQTLAEQLSGQEIDLCVFGGDLLHRFNAKYDQVFHYLKERVFDKIKPMKIVVTCGNHDIYRKHIKPMFKDYVSSIDSNIKLNSFVKDDLSKQFSDNISHISDYNNTIRTQINPRTMGDLFYLEEVEVNKKKIALVSINTAWTSFEAASDYGNLLFPTTIVYEIIKMLKGFDLKLLVSHFSLSYLKEYNRIEIEKLLYKNFHFLFTGHTHRTGESIEFCSSDAIFSCRAPSCLSVNSPHNTGYVIIEVDPDDYSLQVQDNRYFEGKFILNYENTIDIPVSGSKKNAIDIRRALNNKYSNALEAVAKKLILYSQDNVEFQDIFTEPVLKPHEEVRNITKLTEEDKQTKADRPISYSELFSVDNFVLFGSEKSGKTMLLLKGFIDYLKNFTELRSIPLYVDLKTIYRKNVGNYHFNIKRLIKEEYNISDRLADAVLSSYKIVLLLDNYEPSSSVINSSIVGEIQSHANSKFILSISRRQNVCMKPTIDDLKYREVFIHGITRKQIRLLTEKWPSVQACNIEDIIEKLTSIFIQLNIHFNYWTVSLFLWIFERTSVVNIHSNVELIDLYIENLLDKTNLVFDLNKDFSFDNYKDFLAELAFYLYNNFEDAEYSASFSEIVKCFEEFKGKNIRIIADSRSVIEYILDKGIITSVGNDWYTFRLNGVFEYFLAYYMKKDESFRKKIIANDSLFLAFGNELEIYSGFRRNDLNLLNQIYLNTIQALERFMRKYPEYKDVSPEIDNFPKLMEELNAMTENATEMIKPLENSARDEIQDIMLPLSSIESGVKKKEQYSLSDIDTDILARHIFILSRIFRSMDAILDRKIIDEVFGFIVDQGCLLFFFFMKDLKKDSKDDKQLTALLDVLKCYSPIFSHTFLYDAVAHVNLEKLVKDHIQELKSSQDVNLYKLFILYFLIIEKNVKNNMNLIDEVIVICKKNNLLLNSIMLKLIYYVVFKCDTPDMESELKKRIIKINKVLNPKDKSARIVQMVDKTKLKEKMLE